MGEKENEQTIDAHADGDGTSDGDAMTSQSLAADDDVDAPATTPDASQESSAPAPAVEDDVNDDATPSDEPEVKENGHAGADEKQQPDVTSAQTELDPVKDDIACSVATCTGVVVVKGKNIRYRDHSYARACRHKSSSWDLHPFCVGCFLYHSVPVCGVETDFCAICLTMGVKAHGKRKDIIPKLRKRYKHEDLKNRAPLSSTLLTQEDADKEQGFAETNDDEPLSALQLRWKRVDPTKAPNFNRDEPLSTKKTDSTPKPGPASSKPGPASSKPGPTSSKPGPASSKAGPASSKSGPASSKPGPASSKPGPASSKPGPASSKPGPASSKPGPASSKPGPASSKPGPASSKTKAGPASSKRKAPAAAAQDDAMDVDKPEDDDDAPVARPDEKGFYRCTKETCTGLAKIPGQNIRYAGHSYARGCRHKAAGWDAHPFCVPCMKANEIPVCPFEAAPCVYCRKLGKKSLKRRKDAFSRLSTVDAENRPRLEERIKSQADADREQGYSEADKDEPITESQLQAATIQPADVTTKTNNTSRRRSSTAPVEAPAKTPAKTPTRRNVGKTPPKTVGTGERSSRRISDRSVAIVIDDEAEAEPVVAASKKKETAPPAKKGKAAPASKRKSGVALKGAISVEDLPSCNVVLEDISEKLSPNKTMIVTPSRAGKSRGKKQIAASPKKAQKTPAKSPAPAKTPARTPAGRRSTPAAAPAKAGPASKKAAAGSAGKGGKSTDPVHPTDAKCTRDTCYGIIKVLGRNINRKDIWHARACRHRLTTRDLHPFCVACFMYHNVPVCGVDTKDCGLCNAMGPKARSKRYKKYAELIQEHGDKKSDLLKKPKLPDNVPVPDVEPRESAGSSAGKESNPATAAPATDRDTRRKRRSEVPGE